MNTKANAGARRLGFALRPFATRAQGAANARVSRHTALEIVRYEQQILSGLVSGYTIAEQCHFPCRLWTHSDRTSEASAAGEGRSFASSVSGKLRAGSPKLERRRCGSLLLRRRSIFERTKKTPQLCFSVVVPLVVRSTGCSLSRQSSQLRPDGLAEDCNREAYAFACAMCEPQHRQPRRADFVADRRLAAAIWESHHPTFRALCVQFADHLTSDTSFMQACIHSTWQSAPASW